MSEISLKVDASSGPAVKVGDTVEAGDKIGNARKTDQPVRAPAAGIVKSVDFRSRDHSFVVVIVEKRTAGT
jgi:Na+-translocating ferredoxin:NAD+ oxidoreductase RnfC subunit